jgi:hypothetical protein
MLSLRSLAFILASAIRRARALSSAALHCSPDRISGTKMATKRATNMAINAAINRAASMSASCEQSIPSLGSDGTIPVLSSPKTQSTQIWDTATWRVWVGSEKQNHRAPDRPRPGVRCPRYCGSGVRLGPRNQFPCGRIAKSRATSSPKNLSDACRSTPLSPPACWLARI